MAGGSATPAMPAPADEDEAVDGRAAARLDAGDTTAAAGRGDVVCAAPPDGDAMFLEFKRAGLRLRLRPLSDSLTAAVGAIRGSAPGADADTSMAAARNKKSVESGALESLAESAELHKTSSISANTPTLKMQTMQNKVGPVLAALNQRQCTVLSRNGPKHIARLLDRTQDSVH